jgi:hypothetical protein
MGEGKNKRKKKLNSRKEKKQKKKNVSNEGIIDRRLEKLMFVF